MTHLDQVREHLADYLATPASFPLVVPTSDTTQDFLNRRDAQHERRKFLSDPAPLTGWGDLERRDA